jgi:quinoprotein glucose dehydrogenase
VENSPYVPLILGDVNGKLGTLNIGNTAGGTNWPGGGLDPETHIFYSQASMASVTTGSLVEPPAGFSDIRYVAGVKGREFREMEGPGFGSAADAPQRGGRGGGAAEGGRGGRGGTTEAAGAPGAPAAPGGGRGGAGFGGPGPQGLSVVKPPYGVVAAVNLDKGELMWQTPHGDTPDVVRNHEALRGLTIPKTGQQGSVGIVVTKTLVIAGDPQVTTPPGRPRGAMLRAYDKQSGAEVGAVWLPAAQSGSPMTYKGPDGRQYIIVAVSGGNYSGEYIGFALPQTEVRTSSQAQ